MNRLEELAERFKNEPLVKWLGASLEWLEEGRAVVAVPVCKNFLIMEKVVQGGIIATVADFAGVYAAMSKIPAGHTPATNLNILFFRPIGEDETIWADATVINESRSFVVVSVDLTGGAGGKLKAHATISFAKPKAVR